MAVKLWSTSASVVVQDETLIPIAVCPCQIVLPSHLEGVHQTGQAALFASADGATQLLIPPDCHLRFF